MSTAPLLKDSPLALLLDGNPVAAGEATKPHADPYARWHGFMERAVLSNGVVASVSHFLSRRVAAAWNGVPGAPAPRALKLPRR